MVTLALLATLVAFSLLACIFAFLAFGFTVYTFIRVRAWEKTETKLIPVPQDTNGFDELSKKMQEMNKGMALDLSDVGFNSDELV